MKTFTLDEAQMMLPTVEALLKQAMEAKEAAETVEEDLQDLGRRIYLAGGTMVNVTDVQEKRAAMSGLVEQAKEAVEEMDSIGVQVKDLDTGLLDFPAYRDGELVLLCWKMGESKIEFWHTLEDGYKGRQPVDGQFGPSDEGMTN